MSSLRFQVISCGRFCVASHLSWSLVVTCMVPGHFCFPLVTCNPLVIPLVVTCGHLWSLVFIYGCMWSLVVRVVIYVRGHTYSCSQSMSFVETCDHLCSFLSIIICTCFGSMFIWSIYIISVHLWFLVVICGHVWYFVVSGRSWSFTLLSTTFVFNFVCLCSFLITCTSMVIPLVVTCGRMCLSTVICDRLSFAVFHAHMFICVYFWLLTCSHLWFLGHSTCGRTCLSTVIWDHLSFAVFHAHMFICLYLSLITCSHLWSFNHSTCGPVWSFAVIHVYVHSITIVVTYGRSFVIICVYLRTRVTRSVLCSYHRSIPFVVAWGHMAVSHDLWLLVVIFGLLWSLVIRVHSCLHGKTKSFFFFHLCPLVVNY